MTKEIERVVERLALREALRNLVKAVGQIESRDLSHNLTKAYVEAQALLSELEKTDA